MSLADPSSERLLAGILGAVQSPALNFSVNITSPGIEQKFDSIVQLLQKVLDLESAAMADLSDVKAALAAEKADLALLVSLVPKILQQLLNGQLSSADAQALIDDMTSDDTSIKSSIDAINKALANPSPTPGP
jgi:hypothetical protein